SLNFVSALDNQNMIPKVINQSY
ncbi:hypothetical protein JL09_g6007, partial [Pichia kudriavzevii]